MTPLERLQALEREASRPEWYAEELDDGELSLVILDDNDIPWDLGTLNYTFIAALRNAAPDLIAVAVAAQALMERPQPCSSCGIVHEDRPTKEAREGAVEQLRRLLAPLFESEGGE